MYSAGELERASMALDKPMKELEERIMADIVRRIRAAGEITSSADWQINRAVQLGMSMDDVTAYINDALSEGENITDSLYSDVIEAGYVRDKSLYEATGKKQIPFSENMPLQQLISGVTAQTNDTLVNITQSLGFAKRGIDGKIQFIELAKFYQQTLDKAMFDLSSGAFDYNTVLKRTVSELTNSGLRTIDYATGWSNRVNVAARRAVMTGLTQITGKVNEDNAEQLETEWFEISWHSGARPSHWWGGKWYKKEQLVSICGLGEVTGLCGANCYHSYTPVIPGISEPTYSTEELAELEKREKEPVEWGSKKYTKYEATQRQRQLETAMRAQREEMMLLKEGGASEDDLINCRARYMVTSHQYTQFSKAMGLPQQRERVSIDGLGNIMQGNTKGGSGAPSPIKVPAAGAKVIDKVTAEERKELLSKGKADFSKTAKAAKTTAFTPAKTKEEAVEYAHKFAVNVDYNKLPLDNANVVNETLTELNEKYPINRIENLKTNSRLKNAKARADYNTLEINPKIGTLDVDDKQVFSEYRKIIEEYQERMQTASPDMKKRYRRGIEQLEEKLKYNSWSVSSRGEGADGVKRTIVHEYGHILADQYIGQINGIRANKNANSREVGNIKWSIHTTYRKAKQSGDIYNISNYAASDEQEFFAETFAMYHLKEKLPDYITEMIKGVLGNGIM